MNYINFLKKYFDIVNFLWFISSFNFTDFSLFLITYFLLLSLCSICLQFLICWNGSLGFINVQRFIFSAACIYAQHISFNTNSVRPTRFSIFIFILIKKCSLKCDFLFHNILNVFLHFQIFGKFLVIVPLLMFHYYCHHS